MPTTKSNPADVTDVTAKEAQEVATSSQERQIPDPALRSIVTENGFAIGFAPGESVKEDGSFELSHSLLYKDAGLAIAQLESVLAHARMVHNQQIFNAGLAQGQRVLSGEQPQQAMDAVQEKPKSKSQATKTSKKSKK